MSNERASPMLAAAMAAWLDQGRAVDALSRLLTAGALGGLLAVPLLELDHFELRWCLAFVVLAGLVELYLAVRVGFDAALFRALARGGDGDKLSLKGLDEALARLGLLPAGKAGRPLEPRLRGARRLFRLQAAALAVQFALVLIGVVIVMVE